MRAAAGAPGADLSASLPGPLPLSRKLAVGAEIVRTYTRVKQLQRQQDITHTISALRAEGPAHGHGAPSEVTQLRAALRLGHIVGRTISKLPGDSRCLVRSLVLVSLLARRGIPSTLVFAVQTAPEFAAHAWVEVIGAPVLPPLEASFERITEL